MSLPGPDWEDPDQVLAVLAYQLTALKPEDWLEGSFGDQSRRLSQLRELAHTLINRAADLEESMVGSMEADTVVVEGVGLVYRAEERRSTWAYDGASERMRDDIARAIGDKLAIDLLTGEVDRGKRALILEAMRMAYEVIPSFANLKVTGRRALGLHLDDYRRYDSSYHIKIEPVGVTPDER